MTMVVHTLMMMCSASLPRVEADARAADRELARMGRAAADEAAAAALLAVHRLSVRVDGYR